MFYQMLYTSIETLQSWNKSCWIMMYNSFSVWLYYFFLHKLYLCWTKGEWVCLKVIFSILKD